MEMVKGLKKKGITVKDERGVSLVRLFGPGVGDEKVRTNDKASAALSCCSCSHS